jgi:hypothetical protein
MITPMWRRSLQILIRLFTLLSLLLFIATLVLWLRSYWREDVAKTGGPWSMESSLGSITICHNKDLFPAGPVWTSRAITPTWDAVRQRGLGFHYQTVKAEIATHRMRDTGIEKHYWRLYHTLAIPYWALTLLFAGLPALWLFQHRRRPQPGLCPTCHYDLRAHTPGQKCPECGTRIQSPPLTPPSS